ncbi:MAG: hypothetical protein JXA24_03765 [Proteobacteria bacterium]|nr:hypothetical protein [Pseudomonadota bacterium]
MRAGGKTTFGPNFGAGAANLMGVAPGTTCVPGGVAGFAANAAGAVAGTVQPHSRSSFSMAEDGRRVIAPRGKLIPSVLADRHAQMAIEGAGAMLAKPLPMASWVDAEFGSLTDVPRELQKVRNMGIQSSGDIGRALDYLAVIDPRLAGIVEVVRKRLAEGKLKIELDWDRDDSAAAQLTFQGRVDRSSNEFGERIVLPGRAGPDALLHEIFHILPMYMIRPIFSGQRLPHLPEIDPGASFRELRHALLMHARGHETISFGAQCMLYVLELGNFIRHSFNSDMMSDLYGAWEREGLAGIAAVFPYYMTHYELREGHIATMLALVIKVEGRTDLTWDEYEKLVSRYKTREMGLLEDYLKKYVTEKGLDVPPDFFSTIQAANRVLRAAGPSAQLRGDKLERVAQASFDALDLIEGLSDPKEAEGAGISELSVGDIPPEEGRADRRAIFAAYAGVVDRVLDNPPASFAREELASLVSFSRLLPPQTALTLARRLKVYLLDANDLSVMLGLILFEKGLKHEGGEMVRQNLDLATLGKARDTIVEVMGEEFVTAFLKERLRSYGEERERFSQAFRIWAQDQFILEEGSAVESDLAELFGHPGIFGADGWQRLGSWLIEHPADIDYRPDESQILVVPKKMRSEFPDYARLLAELGAQVRSGRLSAESRRGVEGMRAGLIEAMRRPLAALARIVEAGGDHADSLDLWNRGGLGKPNVDSIRGLNLLSPEEFEEVLNGMPDSLKERFAVEADFERDGWWSHPDFVVQEVEAALDVLEELPDRKEAEVKSALHTFKIYLDATIEKIEGTDPPRSDPLASRLPSLVERYLELMERHRSHMDSVAEEIHFGTVHGDPASKRHELRPFLSYPIDSLEIILGAFKYTYKLEWLSALSRIEKHGGGSYLRRAMDELRKLWSLRRKLFWKQTEADDDDIKLMIDHCIAPHAINIMLEALRRGEGGIASEAYDFLFEVIPSAYPPDRRFADVDGRVGSWGKASKFLSRSGKIDWALRLEIDRQKAVVNGGLEAWTDRVRRELDRGGSNIGIGILGHFSREFGKMGEPDRQRDMLRLMMMKSLQTLGSASHLEAVEGVKETVAAVHNSVLSGAAKDELLTEYLETLLGLAVAFRGVDLDLLSNLGGILPWRAADAISGDVPHYPNAERVVLRALASVPELVEDRKGKNDRARLGAFAGAGLPLQRHARWLQHLFSDPASAPELAGLAMRHDYKAALAGLGLPHPYDVPNRVSTEWAKGFLAANGDVIAAVIDEGDPARVGLVLRILNRVISSELVQIIEDTRGRDYFQDSALAGSATAGFMVKRLTDQLAVSGMTPSWQRFMEVLFEAGPQSIHRLGAAGELMRVASTMDEFRAIFDAATTNLVFSKRTRAMLDTLREKGDEEAELELMERLLSLHHSRHPGGMVSDFFLKRFMEDEKLRSSYWNHIAGRDGDVDPLVLVELGTARADYHLSGSEMGLARVGDYLRRDFLERYEFYLDAVKFLMAYVEKAGTKVTGYADGYSFNFLEYERKVFGKDSEAFARLVFGSNQEFRSDVEAVGELEDRVNQFAAMLFDAGWTVKVAKVFDEFSVHRSGARDRKRTFGKLLCDIGSEVERLQAEYADISDEYMRDLTADVELPEFIDRQEGLKRDVLVWAFVSLDPAQKNTIRAKLEEAKSDEERLLVMGQAAHFEKLLQLASIHPAVPADLQELFSVFQEDVPHRDEIDAQRTLKWAFVDSKRASIEVDFIRPIKEGTIGGVYRATYGGEPVVIKLMPEGKQNDLDDSLRIVKEIRRFLTAEGYSASGARALDDFLSFYERTMAGEMDLSLELDRAFHFDRFLSDAWLGDGFVVPDFVDELASINAVAMRPLPSRRLGSLSEEQREAVFARIDDELIPAMMERGIFHFDLHPGNIGLAEDGRIVLYDVGRVHSLSEGERAAMMEFLVAAVGARGGAANGELREALAKLGTVRDAEAFVRIDDLLKVLIEADDPIRAVEEIYPRLSEYGFRLGDSYVKLLLMHLTWEGTKEHLRARANGNGG